MSTFLFTMWFLIISSGLDIFEAQKVSIFPWNCLPVGHYTNAYLIKLLVVNFVEDTCEGVQFVSFEAL